MGIDGNLDHKFMFKKIWTIEFALKVQKCKKPFTIICATLTFASNFIKLNNRVYQHIVLFKVPRNFFMSPFLENMVLKKKCDSATWPNLMLGHVMGSSFRLKHKEQLEFSPEVIFLWKTRFLLSIFDFMSWSCPRSGSYSLNGCR